MKRVKSILVFCAVVLFLLSGCSKNKDDVILIGANLPLTGELALYGQNDKKGIDLALTDSDLAVNVKIIYEDNKGKTTDAITAAQRLLNNNIIAVIDDAVSGITLATIPIYTKANVPLISTGATNPSLSGISPYFFRVWNSDAEEGAFAANAAFNNLNSENVIILYLNSDYGLGLKKVFEEQFKSLGGNITKDVSFDENVKDYRSIITEFKGKTHDLIYIIGYAPQTGQIVRNIREQNIPSTILSTVATEDMKFIEIAGQASEGVLYTFNSTPSGNNYGNFVEAYTNMYEEAPQILTDVGYDAMKLVLNAINSGARTGSEVKDYLMENNPYEGASGTIKFDDNGDVHKPMILKVIKDGEFANY